MATESYQFRFLSSISEVDRADWNQLAGNASPFLKHEFLLALEVTGCTTAATGWQPHHLVITNEDSLLIGVVPLYRKTNSYGEYVFDWSWADAYRTNGVPYYPKYLTAVPFTPSTGPRFLIREEYRQPQLMHRIIDTVREHALEQQVSSWHVLFPTETESRLMADHGMLQREGCQFHWFNRGYASFEDFLAAMSSRKRKNIRKERLSVQEQGISFAFIDGAAITDKQWKHFYVFYQSTYLVRGMQGYLSQELFQQLGRTMPENLLLIEARLDNQVIAGALFFRDERKLFGRYWGSLEEYQFLHFETCFYQGIDYCIRNGLEEFDAGAQGEHKIQRGFEPIRTVSNHWIRHPAFAEAIEDFLVQEKDYMNRYRQQAGQLLPFKKHSESAD
ncbi:MAG: GNAT family N-acetyltransferase [Gammaproteobacteria bacterium]|nr:N-acetyltransferase [Pseudomonadales bacterium]MCP5347738.1 N-acetyltransferase [Pseudomonadales bacterium]